MNFPEIKQELVAFLASDTNHLWLVDERVLWDGMDEKFHLSFEDCEADLLATDLRTYTEDPYWTWWSSLNAPDEVIELRKCVAMLLPLIRVIRNAAGTILRGLEDGWSGHPEAVVPTLVNRAGLKFEDIGGNGSFTPPDRIGRWFDKRTWHWKGPVEHVPGKLHFPLLSRYHAQAPDELAPVPQVALLFLTRGEIHHGAIWEEYLAQAHDRARVLAHTKRPQLLSQESLLGELKSPLFHETS